MKPCPVVIEHEAHYHKNIGYCGGISKRDIMRKVEAQRAEAFQLSSNLTRRLGVNVSSQMVRRNLDLWSRVWDELTKGE